MSNKSMADEIEVIQNNLPYEKELELVAKRFGVSKSQALKDIIHEVYTSGISKEGLIVALDDYIDKEFYEKKLLEKLENMTSLDVFKLLKNTGVKFDEILFEKPNEDYSEEAVF